MSQHINEVDLLKWPEPLSDAWTVESVPGEAGVTLFEVKENGEPRGKVRAVLATHSELRYTYPISVYDRILEPSEDASAEAIQLVSEKVWEANPECRRLVIGTHVDDVEEIARAEKGGYRYVVDVDLADRSVSLMAAEPEWVLEHSRNIDIVPTS